MLPWILTLCRLPLAAAFAAIVAVVDGGRGGAGGYVALLALVAMGDLSDMLDGWVARKFGQVSELGGLADPLADSLSRLTMFFAAGFAGWVWIGVPLVMAGRDIVVSYVRIVLARTGRKTSARTSGKVKAIVQAAGLFGIVIVATVEHGSGPTAALASTRVALGGAVLVATVWSLVDYIGGAIPAVREMLDANPGS